MLLLRSFIVTLLGGKLVTGLFRPRESQVGPMKKQLETHREIERLDQVSTNPPMLRSQDIRTTKQHYRSLHSIDISDQRDQTVNEARAVNQPVCFEEGRTDPAGTDFVRCTAPSALRAARRPSGGAASSELIRRYPIFPQSPPGTPSPPTHPPLPVGADGRGLYVRMVAVEPNEPFQYFVFRILVGSSSMRIRFDTHSSASWVFSDLQEPKNRRGHELYHTHGGIEIWEGELFSVEYSPKTFCSGMNYDDSIDLSQQSGGPQFVIPQLAFGVAYSVSKDFTKTAYDGTFGLSMPKAPFAGRVQVGHIPNRRVLLQILDSLVLNGQFRLSKPKYGPGILSIGIEPSQSHLSAGSTETIVARYGVAEWSIPTTYISIGEQNYDSALTAGYCDLASGEVEILVHPNIVSAFYSGIKGAAQDSKTGVWTYPCDNEEIFPALSFMFLREVYVIDADVLQTPKPYGKQNQCVSPVQNAVKNPKEPDIAAILAADLGLEPEPAPEIVEEPQYQCTLGAPFFVGREVLFTMPNGIRQVSISPLSAVGSESGPAAATGDDVAMGDEDDENQDPRESQSRRSVK